MLIPNISSKIIISPPIPEKTAKNSQKSKKCQNHGRCPRAKNKVNNIEMG